MEHFFNCACNRYGSLLSKTRLMLLKRNHSPRSSMPPHGNAGRRARNQSELSKRERENVSCSEGRCMKVSYRRGRERMCPVQKGAVCKCHSALQRQCSIANWGFPFLICGNQQPTRVWQQPHGVYDCVHCMFPNVLHFSDFACIMCMYWYIQYFLHFTSISI